MRNILFGTGEYYHVYNRGVDKRITFVENEDYQQFLYLVGRSKHDIETGRHLVNLHAYALMPNHFHFLVEQTADDGVAQFMQRLSTSYTRWFNYKYRRTGSLFETTYKGKHVFTDAYLAIVAAYIHRNPLDIQGFETIEGLDDYVWTSYPHYRGLSEEPCIDGEVLLAFFGGANNVQEFHRKSPDNSSHDFDEWPNLVCR